MHETSQALLGPWPGLDPEVRATNAGLHVVARAVGLGLLGGAVIGVGILAVILVTV
jgi:hypothetical protein